MSNNQEYLEWEKCYHCKACMEELSVSDIVFWRNCPFCYFSVKYAQYLRRKVVTKKRPRWLRWLLGDTWHWEYKRDY